MCPPQNSCDTIRTVDREHRKKILAEFWNCPECGSTVTQRSRMVSDKETGKLKYGGTYLGCPKGHHYHLNTLAMERFVDGKSEITVVGTGALFEARIMESFGLLKLKDRKGEKVSKKKAS